MGRKIRLEHISKIEGHAKLHVILKGNEIEDVNFEVVEGARFFESILAGRQYSEVAQISSRICGTCGPAHQITGLKAVENAFGIDASTSEPMRKLMYCGMYIQNHATHLYFLALPDYYGFESAIALGRKNPELIKRALRLRKLGNDIVLAIGGREIHPMSLIIDGFSHLPTNSELYELRARLESAMDDALETVRLFASLEYPQFERNMLFLALDSYDWFSGNVKSGDKEIEPANYKNFLSEYMKPYATSKFVTCKGREYMVGALARMNLNYDKASETTKQIAQENKLKFPMKSPFMNNVAQALEIVHSIESAMDLIDEVASFDEVSTQECLIREGTGVAVTEASRGLLFHEYEIKKGKITHANIITPTAQNLANIEKDIMAFLPSLMGKPQKEITHSLEKLIRAYDPCISCSTHFLKVKFHRK